MSGLKGKVAAITGAASGIGRSTAVAFAQAGVRLVPMDRSEAVLTVAANLWGGGAEVEAVVGDAGDRLVVCDIVDRAVELFGGLQIMLANAGVTGGRDGLLDLTSETWSETLRVNTTGVFLAVQAAARRMLDGSQGSIICTASTAGLRSDVSGMAYAASKAAVISIIQTAATELAGTGIRVNAVCPGLIESGMTQWMFDQARARGGQPRLAQLNPLRRGGRPDEIAQVVLFLASDSASFITGQAIAVDGGLSSTHPFIARNPSGLANHGH